MLLSAVRPASKHASFATRTDFAVLAQVTRASFISCRTNVAISPSLVPSLLRRARDSLSPSRFLSVNAATTNEIVDVVAVVVRQRSAISSPVATVVHDVASSSVPTARTTDEHRSSFRRFSARQTSSAGECVIFSSTIIVLHILASPFVKFATTGYWLK
jgi:hypothetical protein